MYLRSSCILSLDLGTTGNRAIVFDHSQKIVSQEYREFTQHYPKPGWVEHDAEEIYRGVLELLRKTFKKISPSRVAAVGITNQRETVVVWDKYTGKPIHRAIVWQCRRTARFCEELEKRGHSNKIHKRTGLFLDAYFSASKIAWILDHVKGARRRAKRGELLCGTIDSWMVWKLSGGKDHLTDTSNASRTMLFNLHTKKWDDWLCRLFRVPVSMLPRVVPSSKTVSFFDKKLFGSALPIAGIVGDQQAAAFAQGCTQRGVIKNTYGTGLFMLECTGFKPKFSKNLLTTVAWSIGDLKHTDYAVEGSVFIGGAAIQWLRDGLQIIQRAADASRMAEKSADNGGVYFVPALVGLGAPYWDPDARGTITGLTRGTQREHLVRAALESMAYQTRDILEIMKKDTGQNFSTLRVDGGASANDFLMQFQADILGIRVERPCVRETTALGAAGLAGIAVGFWKNEKEFNRLRAVDRIFKPNPKFKNREVLYREWLQAVRRSRSDYLSAKKMAIQDKHLV